MEDQEQIQRPFPSILPEYLHARALPMYAANKQRRGDISSPQQWHRHATRLRDVFLNALGGLPERTPLNPRITGTIDMGEYRVEKLIIDSVPDFPVTGTVYVPKDIERPVPGVLIPSGHSATGRMIKAYQAVGIELALNGMVALGYDPVSQGERVQYYDEEEGGSRLVGCTVEHSQVDNQAALIGSNVARFRIWDGMRCLDYLESRPEVDPDRLGCTGNSGGGTLTTYLTALDDRIRVAVPSCYVTTLQARQESDNIADGEQNLFAQLEEGLDHMDMIAMAAPRAVRIDAAEEDYFPVEGTRETAEFCSRLYELLDVGDRFDLFVAPGGHGFSDALRHAAVEWFGQWFEMPIEHPDVEEYLLDDEDLYATSTGQITTAMSCLRACDLVEAEYEVEGVEPDQPIDADTLGEKVTTVLRLEKNPLHTIDLEPLEAGALKLEPKDGVEHYRLFTDEDLFCVLSVAGSETKPIRLVIGPDGEHGELHPGEGSVALLSVCGTGPGDHTDIGERTYQEGPSPQRRTLGREAFAAYYARILGFPLLALRVRDILAAMKALRDDLGFESVTVEATGRAGIWALHAAVLEPDIGELVIRDCLWSYELMIREPEYTRPHLADIPRGALLEYDLPHLCAALAPRPLTIERPQDALGEEINVTDRPEYRMIQDAYGQAAGTFTVE